MKKPQFSQKLLDTINRVHVSASEIYASINHQALELVPAKESIKNTLLTPPSQKMKR